MQAVPDANILTLTETLEAVRRICDAVKIPVIADCDNGYGNAINVIRTVERVRARRRRGHLHRGQRVPEALQLLRRRAARARADRGARAQGRGRQGGAPRRRDFVVIARTEALIAGLGLDEALRARARLRRRGRRRGPHPLEGSPTSASSREFAAALDAAGAARRRAHDLSRRSAVDELAAAGFRLAIFANQALRAAIVAMRDTLRAHARDAAAPRSVEDRIVPLEEVYELVGVPGAEGERAALPVRRARSRRGRSSSRRASSRSSCRSSRDRPKTMLDVKGKTILERQVEALGRVRHPRRRGGARLQEGAGVGARRPLRRQRRFAETGELYSLFARRAPSSTGPFVVLYGDILFERARPREAPAPATADVAVVVDRAFPDTLRAGEPLPPTGRSTSSSRRRRRRPALRRAGRRQPRAAHRPRGRRPTRRTASSSAWPCFSARRRRARCATVHAELRRAARRGARTREPHRHPPGHDRPRRIRDRGRHPQGLDGDRQLRRLPPRLGGGDSA